HAEASADGVSGVPGLKAEEQPDRDRDEQRARHGAPPSVRSSPRENLADFLPCHGRNVVHGAPASVWLRSARNASSSDAAPLWTSSTSAPCSTSSRTSG